MSSPVGKTIVLVTLVLLMVLVLLLDLSVFVTLFLGMVALFLSLVGWKKSEEKLKKSLRLLFWSLLIITFWYSPGYWWQLLKAPSLAGKSLLNVISLVGQLLPAALAISLAMVSGRIVKSKDKLLKFLFYFGFIFGFLTLLRFISDPDFW